MLLDANPELVHALNNENREPLHWAAINGHSDTALLLIERGASVNAADQEVRVRAARSCVSPGAPRICSSLID